MTYLKYFLAHIRNDVQSVAHYNWWQFLKRRFNSMDHDTRNSSTNNQTSTEELPLLNIVMHVVGPLDEIEPFVALGLALANYGHRVRIATHLVFEDIIKENGLDFFDIEGSSINPSPGSEEVRGERQCPDDMQKEHFDLAATEVSCILDGCWRSCFQNSNQFIDVDDGSASTFFLANAIIANPPSLGHVHCAEKLGIPLHLMSTYVYTTWYEYPRVLTGGDSIHLLQKSVFSNEVVSSSNSKYSLFVTQRCYDELLVIYYRWKFGLEKTGKRNQSIPKDHSRTPTTECRLDIKLYTNQLHPSYLLLVRTSFSSFSCAH